MDETVVEFIKRTISKIPMTKMMTVLQAWNFLSENQLQTVNFRKRKESLVHDLVLLCQEKHASVNDVALLDIIYTQFHRHQKVWDVFQMTKEPGDDIDAFDMKHFKRSFKKILQRALKNQEHWLNPSESSSCREHLFRPVSPGPGSAPAGEGTRSDSSSNHTGNSVRLRVLLSRGPLACGYKPVTSFLPVTDSLEQGSPNYSPQTTCGPLRPFIWPPLHFQKGHLFYWWSVRGAQDASAPIVPIEILVSVTFRDAEESAVWIRIAWGTQWRKPNQYKPTYVVYYSQAPYAFVSSSRLRSSLPLLGQALTIASKHHRIVKMDFRSRYLDSLKAIVFKQYDQTFETHNTTTSLQERSLGLHINMDSRIIDENRIEKDRIQRVTQESFGDYPQPRLEFAQYKLETKFKSDLNGDILAERKEPLRCLVKFSSPNLLEALKSLAPAGIADAPLSPLLTCIPKKRMNYFKIKDK